ncbi:MAG TPA: cupin domain-containing protein [Usitatibacter sp.]|nr:cupin domain-containing protein [Usitatibacter sp.]
MKRHWQRKPLLVRGAFPRFVDPLTPREVLAFAGSADVQSRLVRRRGARWTLEHGPIPPAKLRALPRRDWTVLVQDTNHLSPAADRLLQRFDFIPHARIDDVMVSYAVPGGTVGPHVDSYDVFLLQGHGRRRWQVSRQRDRAFVPGLPLKILARFEPQDEWVLEAGDMLYLPPGVAHYGIAETECLTWSIGFRAPTDAELARSLLDARHDDLELDGQYGDPGAHATRHPGEIPRRILEHAAEVASRIRWTPARVREHTGRFLTEPKAHVFFEPPARPLGREAFACRAAQAGISLDPRSRLAFSGTIFFMNGETAAVPAAARPAARALADGRRLAPPVKAPAAFWQAAHAWYLQGFVHLGGEP